MLPLCRIRLALELDHVLTGRVGGEGLDVQLPSQRRDPVLSRADPLAADLNHLAIADRLVQQSPADALAGLEHQDRPACRRELPGGRQAGKPGPHDDDIDLRGPLGLTACPADATARPRG